MTVILAIVALLFAAGAENTAVQSRFGEWIGRVETGVMAIGGESTGTRLITDDNSFELSAEGELAARLRTLAGQQVTIRGRLRVRPGIELRERRIITVTEIRLPTALVRRRGGEPIYLVFWRREVGDRTREKIARLPADTRAELERRLARRPPRSSAPEPVDLVTSFERSRGDFEAALVAYSGPSAAKEAAAYAAKAKLWFEWEGFPRGPLEEARFAADYLEQRPDSLLRGYLQLFQLHRLRAAFEAGAFSSAFPPTGVDPTAVAGFEREQRQAAELYRALYLRIEASSDALLSVLAADLDAEPYVYIDVGANPRERQP